MNIFDELGKSHTRQRELGDKLLQTTGNSDTRNSTYDDYKIELHAHAVAEERNLYTIIMDDNNGISPSRHAIAEHHAIDEIIEKLDKMDMSSAHWLPTAKDLVHKVENHLDEEENRFFQMAGKILTETQKKQLASSYKKDFDNYKSQIV